MKQERNAKCLCGSGLKYKKCCLLVEREKSQNAIIEWKERIKERAAQIQRNREIALDEMKANAKMPSTRGVDPVIMALALAAHGRSFRL